MSKTQKLVIQCVLFIVLAILCASCQSSDTSGQDDKDENYHPQSMITNREDTNTSIKKTSPRATIKPPTPELKFQPLPLKQVKKAEEIYNEYGNADLSQLNSQFLYKINCGLCHGFKGNAKVNGATDLTKSKVSSIDALGLTYFGRGNMPPFKSHLSELEMLAVIKYANTLK